MESILEVYFPLHHEKWTSAIDEVVLPQRNECYIHILLSLPIDGEPDN